MQELALACFLRKLSSEQALSSILGGSIMKLKIVAVAAVAAGLLATGAANATTTALGPAVVGTPLSFGGFAAPGPFNDIFTFTLPTNGGSGYSVTNFTYLPGQFNTMLATLSLFSNPDGILYNADDALLSTSFTPGGGSLALSWGASNSGSYYLAVGGLTNGTQGGIYNGAISVTAVPEPETYAMMLAGLGALGFLARRRRNS
jgi:hypothetical protein